MMKSANPIRGEAEVKIGEGKYVLAATMEGLAQLSSAVGCITLQDLYNRMLGTEVMTTLAGLRIFTMRGEVDDRKLKGKEAGEAAAKAFMLSDALAVQSGFAEILAAFVRPASDSGSDSGNGASAQGNSPTS